MTNQPATASQKTDEVANKTTPSMTVDTIFSGTGFSGLLWNGNIHDTNIQ
ncbi:Uncharacterised protein [Klebsiella pneumoniae]|uniref:Uncharacterized protein n=1 Tax=Klebsiella pneumoniae TaxID=573 RepID=A0A378F2E6_KLEPN|nr:Uncharacterised protein [Klebsiella pneumoniae]